MEKLHGHTLAHWKKNAEKEYSKVPISVIKYIICLEERIKQLNTPTAAGQSEQFKCDCGCTNHYKNKMYDSVMCANCGNVYTRI